KLNFNEHDKAIYHQERALSLNPNSDLVVVQQGELLTWLGRPEEGIEWIQRAMRLNPYHPQRFWSHLGRAQYTARNYADAIQSFSKLTAPDHTHHAFLAASSAQLGNRTAAAAHAREVLQQQPNFTVQSYLTTLHYRQASDNEHLREGLLKAGLPELVRLGFLLFDTSRHTLPCNCLGSTTACPEQGCPCVYRKPDPY